MTIGIIDDQLLFREGLRRILSSFKDVKVIIEANDSKDLLSQINDIQTCPQVVIISSPGLVLNNNYILREIKQNAAYKINVLVLLANRNDYIAMKMIIDGADGCLFKDVTPAELRRAVFAVASKLKYWPDLPLSSTYNKQIDKRHWRIDVKYVQFLSFCATDMGYREMAESMKVSIRTIESYRDSLFARFNVSTRPALVAFALRNGIIK